MSDDETDGGEETADEFFDDLMDARETAVREAFDGTGEYTSFGDVDVEEAFTGRVEDFDVSVDTSSLAEIRDAIAEAEGVAKRSREYYAGGAMPSTGPFESGIGSKDPPIDMDEEYETYALDIKPEQAQQLMKRVYDAIESREQQGFHVEELILGVPQYKVLEPWAQQEYGFGIEDVLSSVEITVVPGPQIHAVIPNQDLLVEKLSE